MISSSTSQELNPQLDFDFRVLFLEDTDLSTNRSDGNSGGVSSSVPRNTLLVSSVINELNDLERLLTRINLMIGRNTAYSRPTTHRLTNCLATISVTNDSRPAQPISFRESSQTSPSPPAFSYTAQRPAWHSIPTEIHLMIYHHYFRNTHYTIHDSSPATACLTRSASNFWKHSSSPSRTIHSSHINFFLASREITYTAHPIWLSTSTFSFGDCIVQNPRVALWQMNMPRSLLTQVRIFEADKEKVVRLINVLEQWKQRIGIVDFVGNARGREEVPFVLRCRGEKHEFATFEVFGAMYWAGLYGMRIEYVGGPGYLKREKPGMVRIDGCSVDSS